MDTAGPLHWSGDKHTSESKLSSGCFHPLKLQTKKSRRTFLVMQAVSEVVLVGDVWILKSSTSPRCGVDKGAVTYDTTLRCGDSRSPQGSPCPFFCLIADLYLDPKWEAFTFFDVLTSPPSLPVSRPLLEGPQHGSRVRMCSSNLPSCQDSQLTPVTIWGHVDPGRGGGESLGICLILYFQWVQYLLPLDSSFLLPPEPLMLRIWSLCTGAELDLRDRVK